MEKFSLKWNDFHSNVSKSFGLFRSEEYLQDVTLMSEDYYQVYAHKLVLSACSEHFRNIFKNSKKSNTLICLDGVSKEDLKNILDFIYLGESHIFQDKLDRFLKIAEKLKLEGIMSQEEEKEIKQQEEIFNEDISKPLTPPESKIQHFNNENRSQEVLITELDQIRNFNKNDFNEIDQKINEYGEKTEDGNLRCTLCGKVTGKISTNFRNHVERYHMEGLSFDCPSCDKTFRSRGSLSMHKNRNH